MNDDTAKARWMVIQVVRWTGFAIFLVGLMVYSGKVPLPKEAGYVLMAVGLLDALFMPSMLSRIWKTPL